MMIVKRWECPRCKYIIDNDRTHSLPIRCRCGFEDATMTRIITVDNDQTEEEVKVKKDKVKGKVRGYGIPQEFIPPQPPKRSDDLPESVKQWLMEGIDEQEQ